MTTAYENFGDQSPDAKPAASRSGEPSPPAALKPIERSRGEVHTVIGAILIVLSFISTAFPSFGIGPVLTWLRLFLAGAMFLCTGSLIRAILDAGKATK